MLMQALSPAITAATTQSSSANATSTEQSYTANATSTEQLRNGSAAHTQEYFVTITDDGEFAVGCQTFHPVGWNQYAPSECSLLHGTAVAIYTICKEKLSAVPGSCITAAASTPGLLLELMQQAHGSQSC